MKRFERGIRGPARLHPGVRPCMHLEVHLGGASRRKSENVRKGLKRSEKV